MVRWQCLAFNIHQHLSQDEHGDLLGIDWALALLPKTCWQLQVQLETACPWSEMGNRGLPGTAMSGQWWDGDELGEWSGTKALGQF